MATSAKPIATISYNTFDFLIAKLKALFEKKKISDYRFIFHLGEDGDKDHFHVWLVPTSSRYNPEELREFFNEIDLEHPANDKPLGCMPFRGSNIEDWLLYALHDEIYLAEKGEGDDGKRPYLLEEIITPFPEQLHRDYRSACAKTRQSEESKVIDMFYNGSSYVDIISRYPKRGALLNTLDFLSRSQRFWHTTSPLVGSTREQLRQSSPEELAQSLENASKEGDNK